MKLKNSSKEGVNIAIKHILWHNNQTYLSKNQTYPLKKKKKKKECKKNCLTQNIKNIRKKQDNYPPKNTGLQTRKVCAPDGILNEMLKHADYEFKSNQIKSIKTNFSI